MENWMLSFIVFTKQIMFRFVTSKDKEHHAVSTPSADESDDGYSELDLKTVQSEKQDDGFSFFGFKLFEADETFQDDHLHEDINASHDEDYDEDDNEKEVPVSDHFQRSHRSGTGRSFWKPKMAFQATKQSEMDQEQNNGYGDDLQVRGFKRMIKGNLIRRAVSERSFLRSKNETKINGNHQFDSRDDSVQGTMTASESREMFDNNAVDATYANMEGSISKRCFPSFILKKQDTSIPVSLATIKEEEKCNDIEKPVERRVRIDKYYIPDDDRRASRDTQIQHPKRYQADASPTYKKQSSLSSRTRGHENKKYTSSTSRTHKTQSYVKPSYSSYDMWDDESSGWFSLESLDAR